MMMATETRHDLGEIVRHFAIDGCFLEADPIRAGHINDTYACRFSIGSGTVRYVFQRINHHVFREPEKLMENVVRVTAYARERIIAAGGDPERETLNLVAAVEGGFFHRTAGGDYWRAYKYIEGANSYNLVRDHRDAYHAARAFGRFQRLLCDLPGARLHETIPGFHHTPGRFAALVAAVESDPVNRAAAARDEIAFALAREEDTHVATDLLARGILPERVTHNDTKLNNVLLDEVTGEGICVIDLDTIMPGSVLYDFGDLVRFTAATAAEDERDLGRVGVDLAVFNQLARGYLDGAREILVPAEWDHLAYAGKLLTLECGMRFLTDYLQGDTYFKTHREGHNLDRCRTQFKMVAEMEREMGRLEAVIRQYRAAA